VGSNNYTADFNELKAFGGDGVTTPSARTPEQTEIGLFWLESSPLAWNRMARSVSASRGLDLWENARLFGLLNLAMADGYIGNGDAKSHYHWCPVKYFARSNNRVDISQIDAILIKNDLN
jgi:hypothetical protein